MSVGTPPPQQPPQLSPDRKWVWDGAQWRPLAVHEAVFPNWGSVGAGVPPEVMVGQAPPQPRPLPAPSPVYRAPAMQQREPPPVPLWVDQPRPGGVNSLLYVVAGLIVLVIAGVLLSNFLPTSLPWQQTAAGQPRPSPTPPITDYSELGRADRLVNKLLAPPLADLTQATTVVDQSCSGAMTLSCEDALSNTDTQVHRMQSVIDREYIPPCVASGVDALRSDLTKIDSGALMALKGARDSHASEVSDGLSQLAGGRNQLQVDAAALRNTVKSSACSQV